MELGHWVTGSMGHLGHLSRPGHRVIILTRRETRVFPVFEKMPKMKNVQTRDVLSEEYCMLLIIRWLASIADHLVTEGEFLLGHMNLRCTVCGTVP